MKKLSTLKTIKNVLYYILAEVIFQCKEKHMEKETKRAFFSVKEMVIAEHTVKLLFKHMMINTIYQQNLLNVVVSSK